MGGSGRFTVLDPDEGCAGYGREGPSGGPEIVGSAGRGEQTRPGTGCWTKARPGCLVRVFTRKPSYLARLWEGCTFFFQCFI